MLTDEIVNQKIYISTYPVWYDGIFKLAIFTFIHTDDYIILQCNHLLLALVQCTDGRNSLAAQLCSHAEQQRNFPTVTQLHLSPLFLLHKLKQSGRLNKHSAI